MKRLFYFIVLLFFASCFNNKFQKAKGENKDYSWVYCKLQSKDIDTLLPKITEFSQDPVILFKNKYPNATKMTPDSITHVWNDFVFKNNSMTPRNMFPGGALLCGKSVGKCWVVTTSILKNGKYYMWADSATFKIGYKYIVKFTDKNRIKF